MGRRLIVAAAAVGALALLGCDAGTDTHGPSCSLEEELQQALGDVGAESLALLACPRVARVASGTSIPVDVALANLTDSTVSVEVQFAFGAYLDATIMSDDLGELDPDGFVDVGLGTRVLLGPREYHADLIHLPCVYGTGGGERQCVPRYDMSHDGTYTVTFRYAYPFRDGVVEALREGSEVLRARSFVIVVE